MWHCDRVRELVIIVPMLHRSHRVDPLIESIREATDVEHRVMFVGTLGDVAVIDAITRHDDVDLELIEPNTVGDYAKKINHGYRATTEPYLFLGADDLRFHPGWFQAAVRHMSARVGVVGTQDRCNTRVKRGVHATHSLVARSYVDAHGTIDEPGKVLHEGYVHEFVDDEFIATAKRRHAFLFEHRSVVEHLHPMVGKAPWDPMYAAQRTRMVVDRATFQQRQRLWT